MATLGLDNPQAYNQFWQRCVAKNLGFWQAYLAQHGADIQALDREWEAVAKAIALGLELDPAWPQAYELVTGFTGFMERRGYWGSWQTILNRSLAAAQQQGDPFSEVTLLALLARLRQQQGHFKEMVTSYRRAIKLAQEVEDKFNEGRACTNLGYFYIEHGRWWRAEILCCYALRLFEEIGSDHGLAHTENHLGLLYTRQGRWEEAQQRLERACALWRNMGDNHNLVLGLANLGLLYLVKKETDKALEYFHQALNQALQIGDEVEAGIMYINLADTHRVKGEMATAEKYAQQAAQCFQNYRRPLELSQAWAILGIACLYQDRWPEAQHYLYGALELVQQLQNDYREAEVLLYLVEYELTRGNPAQARVWLDKVEQLIGSAEEKASYQDLQKLRLKYRDLLEKEENC